MSIDLTKPIDIAAVNDTAVKYTDVLKGLDMLDAMTALKHMMPYPGVQSSVLLGKTEHGSISKKYDGTFAGDKSFGTIVPRTLTVYPIVAEMSDEPERYRRSFIADVAGGLWPKKHPFELWLLNYGISIASEDLYGVLWTAEKNDSLTTLESSFDGFSTIIDKDITSGLISTSNGNMYETGELTRANCGDKLLEMWRALPDTMKRKKTKMFISHSVGELYDDWYRDEHDNPPFVDQAGQMFVEGTNKKCELVREAGVPNTSQRVVITLRENMHYGFDKMGDFKNMKAFNSGNPYLFTAAMKYVFGTQFTSIHKREFLVNDQPAIPSVSS